MDFGDFVSYTPQINCGAESNRASGNTIPSADGLDVDDEMERLLREMEEYVEEVEEKEVVKRKRGGGIGVLLDDVVVGDVGVGEVVEGVLSVGSVRRKGVGVVLGGGVKSVVGVGDDTCGAGEREMPDDIASGIEDEEKWSPYKSKMRQFLITVFDQGGRGGCVYDQVMFYLRGRKQLDYIISCHEVCPTTGRPHYHIYCHFTNSVQLSQKKCFHSRLDIVRGTVDDCIKYIRKTGVERNAKKVPREWYHEVPGRHVVIREWGSIPKETGGRISAEELMNMTDNEIIAFDARCHSAYIRGRNLMRNPVDVDVDDVYKTVKVYFIQGPSKIGKTTKAKDIVRESFPAGKRLINWVKYQNEFWMHAGGMAKTAIYDEWRDNHMKPTEFINFIDYNMQGMNTKGGSLRNRYELIIITSTQKLKNIYRNVSGESRIQWERRIEVIDMYLDDSDDEAQI